MPSQSARESGCEPALAATVQAGADVCAAARPGAGPLCTASCRRLRLRVQSALRDTELLVRDLLAQWEGVLWEPGGPGLTANVNRGGNWDEMQIAGD